MIKIFSEISNFFTFLLRPFLPCGDGVTKVNWGRTLTLPTVLVILQMPIWLSLDRLKLAFDLASQRVDIQQLPPTFFLLVLVGPVIEEFIFRAGLRNPFVCLIAIPSIALLAYFSPIFPFFPVYLGFFLLIAFAIYLYTIDRVKFLVYRYFCKSYNYFFYVTVLSFAAFHIPSGSINNAHQALLQLALVSPYVVTGGLLGYLRLRNGMLSCIAAHSTMNFLSFIGIIFFAKLNV